MEGSWKLWRRVDIDCWDIICEGGLAEMEECEEAMEAAVDLGLIVEKFEHVILPYPETPLSVPMHDGKRFIA